jgi:hypothetical protein
MTSFSHESKQLSSTTIEYFDMFTSAQKEKVDVLFDEITGLKDKLTKKMSNPKILYERFEESSFILLPRLRKYIKIIDEAFSILFIIKRTFIDNEICLRDFSRILGDKKEIDMANKIGKEARTLSLASSYEVVATFSEEIKYKDIMTVLKIRQLDERHMLKFKDDKNSTSIEQRLLDITNLSPNKSNLKLDIKSMDGGETPKGLLLDESTDEVEKRKRQDLEMCQNEFTELEEVLKKKEAEHEELRKKQQSSKDKLGKVKTDMFNNMACKHIINLISQNQ